MRRRIASRRATKPSASAKEGKQAAASEDAGTSPPSDDADAYGARSALPLELVEEILKGNVTCFVGAGFSRPSGLPLWGDLLEGIAEAHLKDAAEQSQIAALARSSSSHDLDMAAQILEDKMGEAAFDAAVRKRLTVADLKSLPQAMQDRHRWLQGIPFSSIVTTNFDNLISGLDPAAPGFGALAREVLRDKKSEYMRLQDVVFRKNISVPVVKLHGDVERKASKLVCTRKGYRDMLYGGSAYGAFAFTDAYFAEMRNEVVSLFGEGGKPLAYALLPDVTPVKSEALRLHEGLAVLDFDTQGGEDFSGFDGLLSDLYQATNPAIKFGRLLHRRRLLWLHTDWKSSRDTRYLKEFLEKANGMAQPGGEITTDMVVVASAEEALAELRDGEKGEKGDGDGQRIDVLVACFDAATTHGDRRQGTESIKLLEAINADPDLHMVPTVVFGSNRDIDQRTATVLKLGAAMYTDKYFELLEKVAYYLQRT